MIKKNIFVVMLLVFVFSISCGEKVQKVKRDLPKGPEFSSIAQLDDSGTVRPIDKKSEVPIKIAIIGLENNEFWLPVREGAAKAKEELEPLNCTVDWIVPAGDAHTSDVYGNAIESAMAQQYDGIAVIAGDSGIVTYINRAVDAGIPVATFNVETTNENKRLFFVGADLYTQGQAAGDIMIDLIGTEGEIAIITGFFSVEGLEARRLGFLEVLEEKAPNIKIVGQTETLDRQEAGYTQARDFMTANPNLSAFYVVAGGSIGVGRAVAEAGKSGKIKVMTYDFMDDIMKLIDDGAVTGTIGQQPFAQGHDPAIRLYNYLVGGEVPPAARLFTKSDFVTKENLSEFWTPLKD